MTDEGKKRYRCPACQESDGMWESIMVSGWRSLDEHLQPKGEREVDWVYVEEGSEVGCSCGWEGSRSGFEHVGIDGEPLPYIHRNQQALVG